MDQSKETHRESSLESWRIYVRRIEKGKEGGWLLSRLKELSFYSEFVRVIGRINGIKFEFEEEMSMCASFHGAQMKS